MNGKRENQIGPELLVDELVGVLGWEVKQDVHGRSTMRVEVCGVDGDTRTIHCNRLAGSIPRLLQSRLAPWRFMLVAEVDPSLVDAHGLQAVVNEALSDLRNWNRTADEILRAGAPHAPSWAIRTEGSQRIAAARSAWLQGCFGESRADTLQALRRELHNARRRLAALDGAARLLGDAQANEDGG